MPGNRLSDRGFTSTRGLSYTLEDTATNVDAALPASHGLGAVPSSLELWVEVSAGEWEQHDASTYVTASSTALTSTGTTLASVVGGATNVRLVAAAGAVALSVAEASASQAGIVSTGTQTFGGAKTFSDDLTVGSNALFVDVSTDNVGIGTPSPDAKLTLNDPGQTVGITFKENGTTRARLQYDGTIPGVTLTVSGTSVEAFRATSTGAWTLGPVSAIGGTGFAGTSIVGRTDGNSPATGYVGNSILSNPTVTNTLTSGVTENVHSVTLPAGHWLVTGQAYIHYSGMTWGTGETYLAASLSTSSAILQGEAVIGISQGTSTTLGRSVSCAPLVVSSNGTTVVYLVAITGTFSAGTVTVSNGQTHIRYVRIA